LKGAVSSGDKSLQSASYIILLLYIQPENSLKMKITISIIAAVFMLATASAYAQINNPLKVVKDKVNQKVNKDIDKTADDVVNPDQNNNQDNQNNNQNNSSENQVSDNNAAGDNNKAAVQEPVSVTAYQNYDFPRR
jgi:hypothetical protein